MMQFNLETVTPPQIIHRKLALEAILLNRAEQELNRPLRVDYWIFQEWLAEEAGRSYDRDVMDYIEILNHEEN